MMPNPIPTAKIAPKPRVWPWIVGGVLLGIFAGCPCGAGVVWMFRPVPAAPVAQIFQKGAPDDAEGWTWQKLQDHLAAKGLKTRRGQGKKGMWFKISDRTDLPLDPVSELGVLNEFGNHLQDSFLVVEHASAADASRAAARINDTQQADVIAWKKYVFDARPSAEIRAKLIAALK